MRRGLAVDGGVECEDDLGYRRIVRARHQRVDGKILRADAVERRKRAAQHVIARVDRVRALERPQVGDVGDHHDDRGSRRRSAQTARFWVSILPQTRQISIFSSAVCMAAASGAMICSRFLMRKARRAEPSGAEPWQAGEQLDEAFNLGAGGGGHGTADGDQSRSEQLQAGRQR